MTTLRGKFISNVAGPTANISIVSTSKKLFVQNDEVFVQYVAHASGDRPSICNTEFFKLRDGQVISVEVYFGSETGADATEEEIRRVIDSWAEAIRKKDVEGVLQHFAEDSVRFYLASPLQATIPVRENLQEWFATWKGQIGYEIRDLQVHSSGEVAYTHSLHHLTGSKANGEPDADLWFRETIGLLKIQGQWRIQHAHESVPFSMDGTFKAEVGLRP